MKGRQLELQEIQQKSLNTFLKLVDIFEKNGWKYYLAYGTLIGAVRHEGFIPWDDDFDVWIPRKDYESFLEYCISNKNEIYPYKIMHYRTTKHYPYPIARFTDTRYSVVYHGIKDYGLGIFIDLYPLDEVDPKNEKFKEKKIALCRDVIRITHIQKTMVKSVVMALCKPFILLKNGVFSTCALLKKIDYFGQRFNGLNTDYLSITCWEPELFYYPINDILGNEVYKKFDNYCFRVPSNYDSVLRLYYGDYLQLPPEQERIGHHDYDVFVKE